MNTYDIPSHDAIVTTDPDQARRDDLAERAEKLGEKWDAKHNLRLYANLAQVFYPVKRIETILEFLREQYIQQELEDS